MLLEIVPAQRKLRFTHTCDTYLDATPAHSLVVQPAHVYKLVTDPPERASLRVAHVQLHVHNVLHGTPQLDGERLQQHRVVAGGGVEGVALRGGGHGAHGGRRLELRFDSSGKNGAELCLFVELEALVVIPVQMDGQHGDAEDGLLDFYLCAPQAKNVNCLPSIGLIGALA